MFSSPISSVLRRDLDCLRLEKPCVQKLIRPGPRIMRFALQRANETGAKWKQMFRPGFNDVVNESFKAGFLSTALDPLINW